MADIYPNISGTGFNWRDEFWLQKKFSQATTYTVGKVVKDGVSFDTIDIILPKGNSIDSANVVHMYLIGKDLIVEKGCIITSGTINQYYEYSIDAAGKTKDYTNVRDFSMLGKDFSNFLREGDFIKSEKYILQMLSGNDVVFMDTAGDDVFYGGNGNDIFFMYTGTASIKGDLFNGGSGQDTLVLSLAKRGDVTISNVDYSMNLIRVDMNLSKTATILNGEANGGEKGSSVKTISVERIAFTREDAVLVFDIAKTESHSAIYRLYQAALARTPEEKGFRAWVDGVDNGLSIKDAAPLFRNSDEFKAKYGLNVSTSDYVYLLYQNVLGRSPDAAGLKGWVDALNSGSLSRDDVLIGFSESSENVKLTGVNTENGYWLAK